MYIIQRDKESKESWGGRSASGSPVPRVLWTRALTRSVFPTRSEVKSPTRVHTRSKQNTKHFSSPRHLTVL